MIYLVPYKIAGSRCSGIYAVNATTSTQAVSIIQAIDDDYVQIAALTKEEWGDDLGWDDMLEGEADLAPGMYVNILCGT